MPLIAEVNASEENIRNMCGFLREHAPVAGVELLVYHNFGEAKYSAVGAAGHAFAAPDAAKVEELKQIIIGCGLRIVDFK